MMDIVLKINYGKLQLLREESYEVYPFLQMAMNFF